MKLFLFKKANDEPTSIGAKKRPKPTGKNADRSAELAKELGFGEFIGKGSYGKVFGGHYGDSNAVLKIEPPLGLEDTGRTSNELQNSKRIMALRREAPAEIKRNLPKIHIAKEVTYKGQIYRIVIMEKLEELGESLKDLLRSGDKKYSYYQVEEEDDRIGQDFHPNVNVIASTFKNKPFIKKLVDVFLTYKDISSQDDISLEEVTAAREELKAQLPEAIDIVAEEMIHILKEDGNIFTIKALENKFTTLLKESVRTRISPEAQNLYDSIDERYWALLFEKIVTTQKIPLHSPYSPITSVQIKPEKGSPEEGVINAITWLMQKGLGWADLHEDNALFRPSSGDIVVVDFGLYEDLF